MSKREWTPDQTLAINTKYRKNGESCNLLLSAAAGSGKTAVLVERVIRKILDPVSPVDVDRLLIVTFTNAAAHEMSERIAAALSAELENAQAEGDTKKAKLIKRQQLLLGISQICTIDSFCIKLIRENFSVLGIEPDFSIADASQAEILSEEATGELFSSLYEEGDKDFLYLLSVYASSRDDEKLSEIVRNIYKFTRAIPYPTDWLYKKAEELKCPDGIFETAWFKKGFADCRNSLNDAFISIKNGFKVFGVTSDIDGFVRNNPPEAGVPVFDAWRKYYEVFYYYYLYLKEAQTAEFSKLPILLESICSLSFSRLPSQSEEDKNILKSLKEKAKKAVVDSQKFLDFSPEETEKNMREVLYPTAIVLIELVIKYDNLFTKKKLSKNVMEFHDSEQLAVKLLSENPDITKQVKEKYEEILMDEYQDTSLLQEEIFRHVTNGTNLFMVGDMKQSIYRFRNSDPTIFKAKSDTYESVEDAPCRKIILSQNFRSRREVLDSVNDIFSAIMSEDAGELNYDSDQFLYYGNKDYENINPDYKSECVVIEAPPPDFESDIEEDEDFTNPALEARFVASEINKLKSQGFKVFDGKGYRNLQNRDVVILMTSIKASADIYTAELQKAGIDCFVESVGYFERSEVVAILSLLKIICNPYQDIPLIAVMRSPIGNFTDNELAVIRTFKKGRFFGAVKEISKSDDIPDEEATNVKEKVTAFLEKLNRWREYARYMSSDKLLWQLYEESEFFAFLGAIPGGEEAQANLRLFFERAKQYESNGFEGLFNFVKYMEHIKKKDSDLSSARLAGESHNVVRIMTMHKSKGLEFPIVFITGGGKDLKLSADESRVLLHKDFGIAPEFTDIVQGIRSETPQRAVVKSVYRKEQISEKIRLLYVATTRAKEKLYFISTVSGKVDKQGQSNFEKAINNWKSMTLGSSVLLNANDVLSSSKFIDWVAPVAISSENWKFTAINHTQIGDVPFDEKKEEKSEEKAFDPVKILSFKYPYETVTALPAKVSVSSLKTEKETVLVPKPDFLEKKAPGGASYGTALHKIMEHLVPEENISPEKVKALIDLLVSQSIIEKSEADMIAPVKIAKFYASSVGKRILGSNAVYREQPFEVQIKICDAYPELKTENESILLQGVIDCFFEEDDGLVLVDYKTDRYADVAEIHEKYDRQLELYKYALEKITKKPVKEKIIYLFSTDTYI